METEAGHMAAPEGEPKVLESLRETGDRQVELLERHFRQDKMGSAQKELAVLLGKPEKSVPRRNQGTGKATRAQAQDVVETPRRLSDKADPPRFLVQSDDLPRIAPLLGELTVGDEQGVAARIEALERSHRQSQEKMERMMARLMRSTAPSATMPQVIVSHPAPTSFAVAAATGGAEAGVADGSRNRRPRLVQ